MQNLYNKYDYEAIKMLDDFLPDKIFDSHMHISLFPFCGKERFGIEEYKKDMTPIFGQRYIRGMALVAPTEELKNSVGYSNTLNFFLEELDLHKDFLGSILVKPNQSYDEILSSSRRERIKALKCYHSYAARDNTTNADIHEYLSKDALEVANKLSLAVIIHLVKEKSLSDPMNMQEIKLIAKKYPNAKFVLAHSARAFAAWTAIDSVSELVPYENIFFDFSAICESPSVIGILNKIGVSRCMWGSDYNVSMLLGKAISFGDGFYWLCEKDITSIQERANIHPRHIIIENLMAIREASKLSDLSQNDIEDLFYNNACKILE